VSVKRSNAYLDLARYAARQAGCDPATPKAAAESPDARQMRDELWYEYDQRLVDTRTYTGDQVWQWIKADYGARAGRSTVYRDRERLLEPLRRAGMAAAKAKAVIDAIGEKGADDILRGGRRVASQVLFDALLRIPYDALENLDAPQILRMFETLAKLSKAHAETDMIGQKLTEAQHRFDAEIAAAAERAKGRGDAEGRLTAEDILAARKAIFGEVA